MEISITGGGRNIQNHVRQIGPGQFEVSYTPMDEGPHTASVTFNGEHVAGTYLPNSESHLICSSRIMSLFIKEKKFNSIMKNCIPI